RGVLEAVTPLAVLFSNLFNLFIDGMNWKTNPESELDMSLLQSWDDMERYPGKTWLKSKGGDLLKAAQTGQMDAGAVMAALQFLDSQWQNHSFVTAFISGLPGYRSNVTLGETKIKTEQSQGVFDGMARNLEAGGVAAVELAFDFLYQYLRRWEGPQLQPILGPHAPAHPDSLRVAERVRVLGG